MGGHLSVGLRFEHAPAALQFRAQFLEILDDAIVDERDLGRGVGLRIARGRRAVGRPAGMRDAGLAGQPVIAKRLDQIVELSFGPAALVMPVDDGRDAGRIIAAILQPPQSPDPARPEERRAGKGRVSTGRTRWSRYHYKKKRN